MKKFYVLFFTLLITNLGFGQLTENFDTGLAGSYTTGTLTLSSGDWTMQAVIQENSTNSLSGFAARINDDITGAHLTSPALNGVGTVSFWYRELNSGGGTFALQTSTDGINYTTETTQAYSGITYTQFSYVLNNSSSNLTIRILSDNQAGHLIIDDFETTAAPGGSNDTDTEVSDSGSQPASANISSLVDTDGEAISVFEMDIEDQGSGDGLATLVTNIRLQPHTSNTADWTDNIQGVTLNDGSAVSINSVNITDTTIDIGITSGNLSVADGTSKTVTVGLYLNNANLSDGDVISFMVDADNHGFTADNAGSGFASSFTLGDFNSNDFTIDVEGTELRFTVQPTDVIVDAVMSPAVEVSATDVNGNIDIDYSGIGSDISLSTDGSFDVSAGNTQEATNGVAVFNNLVFDTIDTGITLTATDDSSTIAGTYDSDTFNVTAPPILGWQITSENTEFTVDFDNTVSGVNEGAFLGDGFTPSPASGQLDSDAWASTGMSDGALAFGGTETSGDHARGTSTGGTSTGGFFAFETSTSNYSLGFQGAGSDFTPGTITLRAQNKTGATVTDITVEYTVYVYNDQGRSNSFNFSHSDDDSTYTNESSLDFTSPEAADGSPSWTATQRSITLSGLSIADDGYFYLRWTSDDISGSGSRDEFSLDDIKVNFNPVAPIDYTYNGSWSPSDPSGSVAPNDNIIISSGDASITANTEINSVTINSGASLTINPDVSLTVSGALTNSGTLTMESLSNAYSSLIPQGTVTNTGTMEYNRYTNAQSNGNDLVSSPISGGIMEDFATFAGNNSNLYENTGTPTQKLFGPFDNANNTYVEYDTSANSGTLLVPGKGYRAATDSGGTLTYTGDVNTGTVNITITLEPGPNGKWNLIGNPFPSYLDVPVFLVNNGTKFNSGYLGIYGWTGSGWTTINNANSFGKKLAPGQGFFVTSASVSELVSIDPLAGVAGTGNDFVTGRSTQNNPNSFVQVEISNSSTIFSTEIYFIDDATEGLDPGYDSGSFNAVSSDLSIYTHLVADNTGIDMAIQSLSTSNLTNVVVPLGINASQGQQFTISLASSNLPGTSNVYLEDNVANTWTLLNTSDYSIIPSTELSGTGRFFLHFANSTLGVDDLSLNGLQILVQQETKSIKILGQLSQNTNATVFDLQGRVVIQELLDSNITNNSINGNSLTTGVYIVKLNSENQNKTQKIIIK